MKTFESFSKMPPIPNMTEEKWNSLSELQREEIISEYNSKRERDEEIRKLKDKKKWISIIVHYGLDEVNEIENPKLLKKSNINFTYNQ